MRAVSQRRKDQRGFILLFVFLMAATIALTIYLELPKVAFESQRMKEELLIERGMQYRRAIQLYVRKEKKYPADVDALEKSSSRRYLRKRYIDPMTGKDEWRFIHIGADGQFTDSLVVKKKNPLDAEKQGSQNTFISEGPAIGSTAPNTTGQATIANRLRQSDMAGAPGQAVPGQGAPGMPEGAPGQQGGYYPVGPGQPQQPGQPINPNQQQQGVSGGLYQQQQNPQQGFPQQQYQQQPGSFGYPQQGQMGQQPVGFPPAPGQQQPGGFNPVSTLIPGLGASQGVVQRGPGAFAPPASSQTGGVVPQQNPYQQGYQQSPYQQSPYAQPPGAFANPQAANQIMNQLLQPRPSGPPQSAFGSQGGGFGTSNPGFGSQNPGFGNQQPTGQMGGFGNSNQRPGQMGGMGMGGLGAGIAGVASKYEAEGIKIFADKTKYNEWEFLYDFQRDEAAQGTSLGAQQGAQGAMNPGNSVGNSSRSGSSFGSGGSGFGNSSGSGFGNSSGSGFGNSSGSGFGNSSGSGFGNSGSGSGFGNSSGSGFGRQR